MDSNLVLGPTLLGLEPSDFAVVLVGLGDLVLCKVVAETPYRDRASDVIAVRDPVGSIRS